MSAIQKLQDQKVAWAREVFKGQPLAAKFKHLRKEIDELEDAPRDHMEMADVLLLLVEIAADAGVSADALVECGFTKLYICKKRRWSAPDSDGMRHHIHEPKRKETTLP